MDWIAFLDDNNIQYVTRGPNTRRGEVSIRCPFCGADDPSEHMGIVLEGREAWGCHRNQQHRGKAPKRLIRALLNCSDTQAAIITAQYSRADPDTLPSLETAPVAPQGPLEPLKMPPAFRPIPESGRFYSYLKNRGFDPLGLNAAYDLRCCTTGRWKDRIIIPVYQNGQLVAWTGRALQNPVNAPRYLSTSEAIKTTIWQSAEAAMGGKTLVITEGPFDAIKMDYYGLQHDASAVAVFGTSITTDQIALLSALSQKFTNTVILLDADAVEAAFALSDWLKGAVVGMLPEGVKDPGELNQAQIKKLLSQY